MAKSDSCVLVAPEELAEKFQSKRDLYRLLVADRKFMDF